MPIRREAVDARLAKMREAVTVIRQMADVPPDDLRADLPRLYALERALEVTIECVLDIGNHVIADAGWGRPGTYAEVIRTLGHRGVLPPDFADRIAGMAGLRNVLMHGYLEVSVPRLLELARQSDDFLTFACHVLAYLDRTSSAPNRSPA